MLSKILVNEAGMWAVSASGTPAHRGGWGQVLALPFSACPTCVVRTGSLFPSAAWDQNLSTEEGPEEKETSWPRQLSPRPGGRRARVLVLALVSSSGVGGKILRDSISLSVKCGENAHLTRAEDGNTGPPLSHSLLLPPVHICSLISICLMSLFPSFYLHDDWFGFKP